MTPEAKALASIITVLKKTPGVYYLKVRGGPFSVRGLPDIIGCFRGQFFAIEVKADGNPPTKLQSWTMDRIIQAGGRAAIARCPQDTIDLLASMRRMDVEQREGSS